jgi:nucleotide-binding universal stress UspA family protein
MIKLHRILCPTDFSEFSFKSIHYGCELARAFESELHLLHILQDYNSLAPATGESFAVFTDWLPQLTKQAQERLAKLPGPEWESRVKVQRHTVVGATVDEIVKYAKEQDIDLIVQSTHGRTGLKHFLLGSVAESVVRYAPCPVLTVRHPEHEFVEPEK